MSLNFNEKIGRKWNDQYDFQPQMQINQSQNPSTIESAAISNPSCRAPAFPPLKNRENHSSPLHEVSLHDDEITKSHKRYDNLLIIQQTLSDSSNDRKDHIASFLFLKKTDLELFLFICSFVSKSLSENSIDNDLNIETHFFKNPLCLFQIKNKENVNLIKQLVSHFKKRELILNHIKALNSLEFKLKILKLPYLIKKYIDELDPEYLKNPLCHKIWELDYFYQSSLSAIPDYGYKKILNNPWILLSYKGKNPLAEIKIALTQSLQCVISVEPRPIIDLKMTDNFDVVKDLERHSELEHFLQLLKLHSVTNHELSRFYRSLDPKTQNRLAYCVWMANFRPQKWNFGRDRIENDPRVLLRIKTNKQPGAQNLVEQLSVHFKTKGLAKRKLRILDKFKNDQKKFTFTANDRSESFKNFDEDLSEQLILALKEIYHPARGLESSEILMQLQKNPSLLFKNFSSNQSAFNMVRQSFFQKAQYKWSMSQQCIEKDAYVPSEPCAHIGIDRLISHVPSVDSRDRITITLISTEYEFFAKVGGLASMIYGLTEALTKTAQRVRVILPKYECLPPEIKDRLVEKLEYKENGKRRPLKLYHFFEGPKVDRVFRLKIRHNKEFKKIFKGFKGNERNVTFYFIEDSPQSKEDKSYVNRFRTSIYPPNDLESKERFVYFSSAAAALASKLHTDVIHAHDWHTALVPALIHEKHPPKACVFTVHNHQEQGEFKSYDELKILEKLGFAPSPANLIVKALQASDEITTVSKNYALELQTPLGGKNLDYEMRKAAYLGQKITGIINGGNPSIHDPRHDKALQFWRDPRDHSGKTIVDLRYGPEDANLIEKKKMIGNQLQYFFHVYHPEIQLDFKKPLILAVLRYDLRQKGIEMLKPAMETALENNCLFICMGTESQDPHDQVKVVLDDLQKHAKELGPGALIIRDKKRTSDQRLEWQEGPDPCKFVAARSQAEPPGIGALLRSYASLTLVPSKYEPRGFTQTEAQIRGSFPFCRKTGGLVDTVIADGPEMNGFFFEAMTDPNSREQVLELKHKLKDAILFVGDLRKNPPLYRERMKKIMEYGLHSDWTESYASGELSPVGQYLRVYASAIRKAPFKRELVLDAHLLK